MCKSDILCLHSGILYSQTEAILSTRIYSVYLLATVKFLVQFLLDFLRNVEFKYTGEAQMQS